MSVTAWEQEIADGMTHAFFVNAWARNLEKHIKGPVPIYLVGNACMEHWENVCPKRIPPSIKQKYVAMAWRLIGRIEDRNEMRMEDILRKAMMADGHPFSPPEGYAYQFGRAIAYHVIGRAVSWFDNHEMFGLVLPGFEFG